MVRMKILMKTKFKRITALIPGFSKLNYHIIKPVKAGIKGFATVFFVILFIELFSNVFGHDKKLSLVFPDFLLAGLGFFLQMTGAMLKSFTN